MELVEIGEYELFMKERVELYLVIGLYKIVVLRLVFDDIFLLVLGSFF